MKLTLPILLLLSSPVISLQPHSSPVLSHNRMAVLRRGSSILTDGTLADLIGGSSSGTVDTNANTNDQNTNNSNGGILGGLFGGSDNTSTSSSSSSSASTSSASTTTTTQGATTTTASATTSSPSSTQTQSSSSTSSSSTSSSSSSSSTTTNSPTSSVAPTTTAPAQQSSTNTPAPDSQSSSDNNIPTSSSPPSGASSAASDNTNSKKSKSSGLSSGAIIAIIVGSSVVGIILIWTIIRKLKFSPSSRFEDKLNPIDFGEDANNIPGFSSNLNLNNEKSLPPTQDKWENFSVANSAEQHERTMNELSGTGTRKGNNATLNGGKAIDWPVVPIPGQVGMGGMKGPGSLRRGDSWGSNGGRVAPHRGIDVGYERSMTPVQRSITPAQGYQPAIGQGLPYPGESRRNNDNYDPYYRGGY